MTNLCPRFGPVVYEEGANPFRQHFCGPGAISVVTGHPIHTVERYISFLRGDNRPVASMWADEIINVMEAFGLVPVEVPVALVDGQHTYPYDSGNKLTCKVRQYPTFIRWLRESREARGEDVYIILTTSHIVVIKGDWIVDNITRVPRPYEEAKHHRRARVRSAYCVMQEI